MIAWGGIREGVHYRREAFRAGFEACGYRVRWGLPDVPGPEDVLFIWNRYGQFRHAADRFEARGRPVLVAENGYLGNDFAGARWYAIARGQHNGAGTWPSGDASRWDRLGVDLAPWRELGGEVVLLPQRGIGPPGVAMPANWVASTAVRLRQAGIKFRIREHPGTNPAPALEADLARASAVVTWGSGAALKAVRAGVAAFSDWPAWIGAPAALPLQALIEGRACHDDAARLSMFRRLAWAQWTLEEIASGEPFRRLLGGM